MIKYKKDSYIHSHYKKEIYLDDYMINSINNHSEKKKNSFESREERIRYQLKRLRIRSEDIYYDYY